ncbi:olfactory receptor 6F1-like [Alligator mississippiensis]|uniref:olfactory receptor 6F1-like n=1 Tax=Alligator mississippiensis TaxID=8496 RepID=UPI002877D6EF|nr:olfactory receptor 6F1-like [Alligator mississippiensis]
MNFTANADRGNQSSPYIFILQGFAGNCYFQVSLFMLFLFMYILTVTANASIILLVRTHPQLHTPMYWFLCNLSFLEIWYTTACVPKVLAVLLEKSQAISFLSCLLQMYFVFSLGCTEYFLLAVMAYDRYLAICYPLHYSSIMNGTMSAQLALGSWLCGFVAISAPAYLISSLSFCGRNSINHFFCDIAPWIVLSCTDTQSVELVAFIISFIVILGSCAITLVSYIYIISTILSIPSAKGRQKTFSTCSSHLIVVIIWYGSTIFLHVKPSIKESLDLTKTVHVLNTIVTPVLNPFIYALRNKEVKDAVRKVVSAA